MATHSCLGNPMDRGVWQGLIPWGHKELDMAELLTQQCSIIYCCPWFKLFLEFVIWKNVKTIKYFQLLNIFLD